MEMDKIIVTTIGGALIAFIWWFFFGKKEEVGPDKRQKIDEKGNVEIDITVDGGYKPTVIFIKKGVNTSLNIVRKDPNTCLGDIILPDFKISRYLPLNEPVKIELKPERPGEYPFHCGMNMFHGKLVVD